MTLRHTGRRAAPTLVIAQPPITGRKELSHVSTRFFADPDRIVAEELPGEVMVVDLDSGYYYVLTGSAAAAWPLLSRGATISETAQALTALYDADHDDIAAALDVFTEQLIGERLLLPADPAEADLRALETATPSSPDGRAQFDEPAMTKYADMANLVQMDPIRDFEARRWPTKFSLGGRRRATPTDGA